MVKMVAGKQWEGEGEKLKRVKRRLELSQVKR